MSFNTLAKDILLSTFFYLDLGDISSCARACKAWRGITKDERIWQVFCNKIGHNELAYPSWTWQTSCKFYSNKIFTHGEVTTSTIAMSSLKYFFRASIPPAVHEDLLAFYHPESDTIQLWNWVTSTCVKQFRTHEDEFHRPGILRSMWNEEGYLDLSSKYLVYVFGTSWNPQTDWKPQTGIYLWDIEEKSDLPKAVFGFKGFGVKTHFSHDSLLTSFPKTITVQGETRNVISFTLYDFKDFTAVDLEGSLRSKCPSVALAKHIGMWQNKRAVHYQNKIFFSPDTTTGPAELLLWDPGSKSLKSLSSGRETTQAKYYTAQASGKYLTIFLWELTHSINYYCSAINVWDLENSEIHWTTNSVWNENYTLDAICMNIDENLFITKRQNLISIYDMKDSKVIRTVEFPSISSHKNIYSYKNSMLVLGSREAYILRLT